MDAAFLRRIAASPDDDLARLVYADFLDDHGRPADAERIRLAVRLDPDRDRFDDPGVNKLRDRVDALTPPVDGLPPGTEVEWRRGLPDTLYVPAPAFVARGAELLQRFPTARRLVLFRLNGWGERVAACEALGGVRELELACWYADADCEALAASPHVAGVERLTVWDVSQFDPTAAVDGPGYPGLRAVSIVTREPWDTEVGWNGSERAPLAARAINYDLLPFAPDFFGDDFLIGTAAGGRPVFLSNDLTHPAAFGVRFGPDGRDPVPLRLAFPPELTLDFSTHPDPDPAGRKALEQSTHAARRAVAAAELGFAPAFIRVELFDFPDDGGTSSHVSVTRYRPDFQAAWGQPDDPATSAADPGGFGATAYRYVRAGEFMVYHGQDYHADRTGRHTG